MRRRRLSATLSSFPPSSSFSSACSAASSSPAWSCWSRAWTGSSSARAFATSERDCSTGSPRCAYRINFSRLSTLCVLPPAFTSMPPIFRRTASSSACGLSFGASTACVGGGVVGLPPASAALPAGVPATGVALTSLMHFLPVVLRYCFGTRTASIAILSCASVKSRRSLSSLSRRLAAATAVRSLSSLLPPICVA